MNKAPNKAAAYFIVLAFFTAVTLALAIINFIGDNYSDILGPVILLGLVVVLVRGTVRAIKKGNN